MVTGCPLSRGGPTHLLSTLSYNVLVERFVILTKLVLFSIFNSFCLGKHIFIRRQLSDRVSAPSSFIILLFRCKPRQGMLQINH